MSMGITQMNSLLSSQHTLKQISNLNTSRVSMTGSSRILATEIEIDKGRGVDTANKEKDLEKMEEGIASTTEKIGSSMTDLNERISSDSKKIREEEAEQKRQEQKAEEKAAENATSTGKTVNTGKPVNNSAADKVSAASDITEPVDTVEISPEAKAAAAAANTGHAANKPAISPHAHTKSTGKSIDKKV